MSYFCVACSSELTIMEMKKENGDYIETLVCRHWSSLLNHKKRTKDTRNQSDVDEHRLYS